MKKILFTIAALSLASFTFADDFGFGDDMSSSEDFGGSSFEESSAPAVAISGEFGAETRAWIGAPNKDSGKYDTKAYKGAYDLSKTTLDAGAYANLEVNYEGDYTGANLKLKLDSSTLSEHPEDVIDEVYANGSFSEGKFQLKAGKIKEIWGKGDKIHVLDNFNANDYSDFIFPDYIDRRLGEVMFKATANLSWDYNLKLEGIFTPWMTADRFAGEDSFLYPAAQKTLTNTVAGIVKHNAAIDLEKTLTSSDSAKYGKLVDGLQTMSSFSANELYPDDLKTLKYGQAGLRMTGTLAGIDWGASYYYGHYKQPSANLGAYIASVTNGITNATTKYVTDGLTEYQKNGSSAFWTKHGEAITAIVTEKYGAEIQQKVTTTYGTEIQNKVMTDYGTKIAAGEMTQEQAVQLASAGYVQKVAAEYIPGVAKEYATAHAQEWYEDGTTTVTDKYELPSLNYDQLQVFGLEAAFVLWKLNTRWEFAYNLTEDIAGDDPWVKNNSLAWVAGFDIDIPIHNLNLNVQETGTFILKNNKIKDGAFAQYDVDYNSDDKYTKNKLIVLLSDKWLNEKLTTEVQGIYCIEDKGYMVAPKIEYNVSEGLTFGLRGVYLHCDNENGEFYNFTADSENNDKAFIELTAKYQF